jgi:RHS repeat-associated protein
LDNYPVALINAPSAGVPEVANVQPDHLGTPRVVIDPVRDVAIWEWSSKSEVFGNQVPNADADGDGVGFELALRFPGQQATDASGLFYNYQRDFDPAVGRYSQSDPIGLLGGISTYNYAEARPTSHVDSAGLQATSTSQSMRSIPQPGYGRPSGYQQYDSDHPDFYSGSNSGPYIYPDRIAEQALAGLLSHAGQVLPLLKPFWTQMSKAKPSREQRPDDCPVGTKPIDQWPGLSSDDIHGIKRGINAKGKDWVGISPDGKVWINEGGEGSEQGYLDDYLP